MPSPDVGGGAWRANSRAVSPFRPATIAGDRILAVGFANRALESSSRAMRRAFGVAVRGTWAFKIGLADKHGGIWVTRCRSARTASCAGPRLVKQPNASIVSISPRSRCICASARAGKTLRLSHATVYVWGGPTIPTPFGPLRDSGAPRFNPLSSHLRRSRDAEGLRCSRQSHAPRALLAGPAPRWYCRKARLRPLRPGDRRLDTLHPDSGPSLTLEADPSPGRQSPWSGPSANPGKAFPPATAASWCSRGLRRGGPCARWRASNAGVDSTHPQGHGEAEYTAPRPFLWRGKRSQLARSGDRKRP